MRVHLLRAAAPGGMCGPGPALVFARGYPYLPNRMKEAKGGNRGIGNLAALLPWVRRHWVALAVGFAFMLVQN